MGAYPSIETLVSSCFLFQESFSNRIQHKRAFSCHKFILSSSALPLIAPNAQPNSNPQSRHAILSHAAFAFLQVATNVTRGEREGTFRHFGASWAHGESKQVVFVLYAGR
jgi:hypothetical protein